jgi:hypothetical protein
MTGQRPFSELTKDFTPARRAGVAAKAAALREAMTLEELRKARSLSPLRQDNRGHQQHRGNAVGRIEPKA